MAYHPGELQPTALTRLFSTRFSSVGRLKGSEYDNSLEKELAAFWKEKNEEIGQIVDRAGA